MAQEAKIRVRMDAEDAKRNLDQVSSKAQAATQKTAGLMQQLRGGLGRGTALAATVAGAIDRASGGGYLRTVANTYGDLAGAAARRIGLTSQGLQEGIANQTALDRAIEQTKSLVGAGGEISDAEIRELIGQFRDLYSPGARNEQRVAVLGQEERVGMSLENAARNLNEAAESISKAFRGLGGGR